jgi:hypothetical protein
MSPDLSLPIFFLFPELQSVVEGQFTNSDQITAKATRALTEVLKNGFQESFQELYTCRQKCVTAQGNHSEGYVV